MNKSQIIPFMLLATSMFTGCNNNPKKLPVENEFLKPATMYYTKEDTVNIDELVNVYVQNMKDRNFTANAELLYMVRNDSAIAYSADQKNEYIDVWSHMNFYDCKVNSFILRSDKNNEVQILMQILKDGDMNEKTGVTSLYLNPVKIGDKWYLTLLDKGAEGVEDVYKVNE